MLLEFQGKVKVHTGGLQTDSEYSTVEITTQTTRYNMMVHINDRRAVLTRLPAAASGKEPALLPSPSRGGP